MTREFEVLLEDQAPLESYIEWLDSMVDQCVVQASICYIFVYCIHTHRFRGVVWLNDDYGKKLMSELLLFGPGTKVIYFFMLNSTEHKIYHVYKCYYAKSYFAILGLKKEYYALFSNGNPFSNYFDLKPFQGAGYLSKGLANELIIFLEHIYDSAPLKPVLKFAVQCHY